MIIDANVENLVREINRLKIGSIQLLCLGNLFKEEAPKQDEKVDTMVEKQIIICDKVK